LYIPSDAGFDINRLPSSVDISSTEDVQYFRDRLLSLTGLPRSYFLHDTSSNWGGSALEQQDVIFSRKLLKFQNAFCEAVTRLMMILSVYISEADIANLSIEVRLRRPPQISADQIESYVNIADSAQKLIATWQSITGNQIVPPELYSNLLVQLGMPTNLCQLFGPVQLQSTNPQKLLTSSLNRDIVYTNHDIMTISPTIRRDVLRPLSENLKRRKAA
jgi:Bacteriophage T4-like portal protein (Gp20)